MTKVGELVDILKAFEQLQCVPTVEYDEAVGVTLAVRILPGDQALAINGIRTLSLFHELQYLADLAQMRSLLARYDMPEEALQRLLPRRDR